MYKLSAVGNPLIFTRLPFPWNPTSFVVPTQKTATTIISEENTPPNDMYDKTPKSLSHIDGKIMAPATITKECLPSNVRFPSFSAKFLVTTCVSFRLLVLEALWPQGRALRMWKLKRWFFPFYRRQWRLCQGRLWSRGLNPCSWRIRRPVKQAEAAIRSSRIRLSQPPDESAYGTDSIPIPCKCNKWRNIR